MPGNIKTILDTIKAARRRMHLAHVQFYGYDNKGKGFSSGAMQLCDAINKNKNITVDVGSNVSTNRIYHQIF